MSLSNSVKTWIIDPAVHNSSRTEFRLTEGMLSSQLKLVDVGVYSTNIVDRSTGVFYPSILGCLVAIKKISLFSGSTMIDEIQELAAYGAVQHLRVSNQAQEDLNRFELLNGHSFALKADDAPLNTFNLQGTLTLQASHKDYVKTYNESAGSFKQYFNNQVQVSNTPDGAASGMLVLSSYLEFLRSVPILPNIPDLRLIIEWNLNTSDYYVDTNAPTAVTPVLQPIRPQLMYEEILGLPASEGLLKIPYQSCIVERFIVPAAADGVSVSSSFRSGAFRNRFLKDLVFFNKVQTNDDYIRAKERSLSPREEKLQLSLNAKKYLPDNGVSTEAMKLQYFNETMGSLNIPLAAAMSGFNDYTSNKYRCLDPQAGVMSHNFSVGAVMINDVVDRMDIEVSRKGSNAGSDQTSQYDLLLFGRVNRLMELQGGVVRLSY